MSKNIVFCVVLGVSALFLNACQSTKTAPSAVYSDTHTTSKITNQAIMQALQQAAPKAEAPAIDAFLLQTFRLVGIHGSGNDDKLNAELSNTAAKVDLTDFPKGSAYLGCNRAHFMVALRGDTFKIGQIATTRKLCPSTLSLEMALARHMQAVKQYKIQDNTLILYSDTIALTLQPDTTQE